LNGFNTENEEQNLENRKLEILVAYFEDTYIGRIVKNNQRKNPLFPIKKWNCYEMIEDNLSKTNNRSGIDRLQN
jgi:hypothetical protein